MQLLRRKPCCHRENYVMPLKILIRIEFYNKSIMERLRFDVVVTALSLNIF